MALLRRGGEATVTEGGWGEVVLAAPPLTHSERKPSGDDSASHPTFGIFVVIFVY